MDITSRAPSRLDPGSIYICVNRFLPSPPMRFFVWGLGDSSQIHPGAVGDFFRFAKGFFGCPGGWVCWGEWFCGCGVVAEWVVIFSGVDGGGGV